MKQLTITHCIIAISACCWATSAAAIDWKKHEAPPDGFTMMVPATGVVRSQELGRGWTGISSTAGVATTHGLSKLGASESDTEIENIAARAIGIPAAEWMPVGHGGDVHGWKHFSAFKAKSGTKYVLGEYGVGAKGNYLFYLETTVSDYDAHASEYDHWYDAIWVQ